MKLVPDCSAILACYFPDEASAKVESVLEAVGEFGAIVPAHFKSEIANGLVMAVRRNRIDEDFLKAVLDALSLLPFEVDNGSLRSAWTTVPGLAIGRSLTVYDALYLDVALRQQLPLATLDAKLAAAAKSAGVELFEMSQ